MQREQLHVAQAGAADPRSQSQRKQIGGPRHGLGSLAQGRVDLAGQILVRQTAPSAPPGDPRATWRETSRRS